MTLSVGWEGLPSKNTAQRSELQCPKTAPEEKIASPPLLQHHVHVRVRRIHRSDCSDAPKRQSSSSNTNFWFD